MNEQKILNTFNRVLAELDRYSKVFRSGGQLEKAVAEVDGDIAWFDDIRNGLEDTIHAVEEAHMSAGIAMRGDMEESTQLGESVQLNEGGLLDSTDEDGFMTRSQIYFMARDAIQLHGLIGDRDEVEPWIQQKVTRAAEDVESIRRHVEYSKMTAPSQPHDMGASAEDEAEFHQDLDDMVHDTFGKRPEEMTEDTESADGTVKTVTTDYDDESSSFDVYHNGDKVGDGWFDLLSDQINFNGEWHSLDGYKTVAEKLASILNGVSEAKSKTRIDKKCWDGYKIGNPKTKMKGDTRVNNCVPESVNEAEEKPYICVHAKKGKHECYAPSSYAAAKKASAHWKLKSTAGIDAHLALDEGADLDDGSKALNPQTVAKNMMKAAKAQAAKKVKK